MKETISTVQSVDRTIAIIELLSEYQDGLGLIEISQRLGLHKSTTHRLLLTLIHHNYVCQKQQDQKYRLTIKMFELGGRIIEGMDLQKVAKPYLEALKNLTNEVVHLVVRDGTDMIYIDKVEPNNNIRMHSRIGARNPLYSTSAGKAIMAFIPEREVKKIWDNSDIVKHTPNTVTDYKKLLKVLETVRQEGYALDDEENESGIRCIGAPIFNHLKDVVGAISISGPAIRVTYEKLEEFKDYIKKHSKKISSELGYR